MNSPVPLSVMIVDDEAPARARLRDLLADVAGEQPNTVVAEAANGLLALVSAALILAALAASGCARNRDIPTQLAPARMTTIGVNGYLWQAALDTVRKDATRDSFLRSAKAMMDELNAIALDMNALFESEVPEDIWRGYNKGDRSIFARRLFKTRDSYLVPAIEQRYEGDR